MVKDYAGMYLHVFNKSIARYGIFQEGKDASRIREMFDYYNQEDTIERYSFAVRRKKYTYNNICEEKKGALFRCIAYCIMPDHYHLLLKIIKDHTLSKYIGDCENGYSRYFNLKRNRKGPLWQSRFQSVPIYTTEQLLHVTRYLHLNPTTDKLVDDPEQWEYSSYKDYVSNSVVGIALRREVTTMSAFSYKRFVQDRIQYQRQLKEIKRKLKD